MSLMGQSRPSYSAPVPTFVRCYPNSVKDVATPRTQRCATNGLMHRSKFAVIARTFIALSCLVAGQEFMQLSALRLRRMMWREVSSAIAPELSS